MEPHQNDRAPAPTGTPWVWPGALLLVMLFTPLGPLWPLVLLLVGGLVYSKNLALERGLIFGAVALAGGLFSAGAWSGFAPSFALLGNAPGDRQTLSLEGIERLEARTFDGAIKVTAAKGEARLTIRRRGDVTVTVTSDNGTMTVQAKRPFFTWNTGASFELELPATLDVNLSTAGGPIEVLAPVKRLEASTAGGRLVTRDTGPASLKLSGSNGPIEITNAEGEIEASTANGDIKVTDARNTTLALETSNGAVLLQRVGLVANSRSTARSSNGPIAASGVSAPAGLTVRGDTANATVDVQLPGFEVQLETERFEAKTSGLGVAELTLDTSNARIQVRP